MASGVAVSIARPDVLDDAAAAAVTALASAVEARDGAPPMSDQALTRLTSRAVHHALATAGTTIAGYAQFDASSAELVGDAQTLPALLDVVASDAPAALVWSHGTRSPLGQLLGERGFEQSRVLHQLRRNLGDPLPEPSVADGVRIRDFVPGSDEASWLTVNAAAFAHHPEQGHWSLDDLLAREAEPWFDPTGFLLAERDDTVIGFHWTKMHRDGIGEVYVLGVDPSAQGIGLGTALLILGLRRLIEHGSAEVLLYVDDDNASAMRLYENFGFNRYDVDIQWRRAE